MAFLGPRSDTDRSELAPAIGSDAAARFPGSPTPLLSALMADVFG